MRMGSPAARRSFLHPTRFLARAGALLLVAAPIAVQGQFSYVTNNGTITITGYTGPGGAVIIPAQINGLPVTSIGDGALADNYNLTSVTIPDSVTSIGYWAFNNCALTNVTIGNSVTSIGDGAFGDCSKLTSMMIPDWVTSIGKLTF